MLGVTPLDSTGNPGSKPLQWTIDSTGVVSQFDNNVLTGYHGKMSSDKKLISLVGTQNVMPYTVQMTIARKRTGTVLSNTDLASIPFAYHALVSGSDNNWEYGAGSSNASRQLTITSTMLPPGYTMSLTPPNFDTLSVSQAGIVTLFNDNTFYGLMTDDKKVIFTIMNGPTSASSRLMVIMVTGQTFTQANYAGAFPFVEFRNLPYLMWAFGIGSIDATGNGSYLSYQDSLLPGLLPIPPTYIRLLSATGVITDPSDGNFHGQMSYNKDITVQTNTIRGSHGLNIGFRR